MKALKSSLMACIVTFIPALMLAAASPQDCKQWADAVKAGHDSIQATVNGSSDKAVINSQIAQYNALRTYYVGLETSGQCSPIVDPGPVVGPTNPPPPPPPTPPTGGGTVKPPLPPTPPEPPVTIPDDPGSVNQPGDTSDSGDDGCVSPTDTCQAQLDAYADQLKAKKVHPCEFVHKMQDKIHELGCGKSYGSWRRHHREWGDREWKATDNCGKVVKKPGKRHYYYCCYHHKMCCHAPYKECRRDECKKCDNR